MQRQLITLLCLLVFTNITTADSKSTHFSVLSYNVAGIPYGLSSASAKVNMPHIGKHINQYDIVAVQEDFAYHYMLETASLHDYKSKPIPYYAWEPGDGLNIFSKYQFDKSLSRIKWDECHGYTSHYYDCLMAKGLAAGVLNINGIDVMVINFHLDTGPHAKDSKARESQLEQLMNFIEYYAYTDALIVLGDTGLDVTSPYLNDDDYLAHFLKKTQLKDACAVTRCGIEKIDRVFFRSSSGVSLEAIDWSIPEGFVDSSGLPLSNHDPILVNFTLSKSS